MSRQVSIVLLAAVIIGGAPRIAVAQSGAHQVVGASHGVIQGGHRAPIDFGAKQFVPPAPKPWPTFRSRFDPPLDESPWQHVPAGTPRVNHHNKVGVNFAPVPLNRCAPNTPFRLLSHDGVLAPCRLK